MSSNDNENQSCDQNQNSTSNKIAALFITHSFIGFCSLDAEGRMQIMHDLRFISLEAALDMAIAGAKHKKYYLNDFFTDFCTYLTSRNLGDAENVEMRPSNEFSCEQAKIKTTKIAALKSLNFEKHLKNSYCALNALLECIFEIDNSNMALSLTSIIDYTVFEAESSFLMDEDTLFALNIFSTESHPNIRSANLKEGLSLFNIMCHTKSVGGRNLLKRWFYNPLKKISEIRNRHNFISSATAFEEELKKISLCLSKIKNIPKILCSVSSGGSVTDIFAIQQFLGAAIKIFHIVKELENLERIPLFKKLNAIFKEENMSQVYNSIEQLIDVQASLSHNRLSISKGINQKLDSLKEIYEDLPQRLSRAAEKIIATHKISEKFAEFLKVLYFPQLGYLLCVSSDQLKEQCNRLGFESCFDGHDCQYFRSVETRELDRSIGDVYADIVDIEIEIAYNLNEKILLHGGEMLKYYDIFCELDCLISHSICSQVLMLYKPEMSSESGMLRFKSGRHILLEKIITAIVPNHFEPSSGDKKRQFFITGPNCSGKSVFLKLVGLIAFMCQIGSFVPAEHCICSVFDRIFTQMKPRESLYRQKSSFEIALDQIKNISLKCTGKSLALIDEFGKGTNGDDGVSLLLGLVQFFAAKALLDSPLVFYVSHLHEVYHLANFFELSDKISWLQSVFINADKEVVFMYRIVEGFSEESLGLHCARLCNIPQSVLDRAKSISDDLRKNAPIISSIHSDQIESMQTILQLFTDYFDAKSITGDYFYEELLRL